MKEILIKCFLYNVAGHLINMHVNVCGACFKIMYIKKGAMFLTISVSMSGWDGKSKRSHDGEGKELLKSVK